MQVRYQAALRPDPQNPEIEFAKESRSRDAIPQVAEERRRMGAPLLAYHLGAVSSSRGALGGSRTLPRSAHRTDYPQFVRFRHAYDSSPWFGSGAPRRGWRGPASGREPEWPHHAHAQGRALSPALGCLGVPHRGGRLRAPELGGAVAAPLLRLRAAHLHRGLGPEPTHRLPEERPLRRPPRLRQDSRIRAAPDEPGLPGGRAGALQLRPGPGHSSRALPALPGTVARRSQDRRRGRRGRLRRRRRISDVPGLREHPADRGAVAPLYGGPRSRPGPRAQQQSEHRLEAPGEGGAALRRTPARHAGAAGGGQHAGRAAREVPTFRRWADLFAAFQARPGGLGQSEGLPARTRCPRGAEAHRRRLPEHHAARGRSRPWRGVRPGDGLRTWFRLDPASTCRTLASPEPTPAKARALKHVLALLYAVRAPSAYLAGDHAALEARLLPWIDRLERERVIDPPLARLMRHVHLPFAYPDE